MKRVDGSACRHGRVRVLASVLTFGRKNRLRTGGIQQNANPNPNTLFIIKDPELWAEFEALVDRRLGVAPYPPAICETLERHFFGFQVTEVGGGVGESVWSGGELGDLWAVLHPSSFLLSSYKSARQYCQ